MPVFTKEELQRLYIDEGKSITQIAELMSRTYPTARYHLLKQGITLRARSWGRTLKPNLTPSTLSYVLGVMDGDGYLRGKNWFQLHVKDKPFADEWENVLNRTGVSTWRRIDRAGYYVVESKSVILANIVRASTREDRLADARAYLKGLYESEGTLNRKRLSLVIYTSNPKTADIAETALRLFKWHPWRYSYKLPSGKDFFQIGLRRKAETKAFLNFVTPVIRNLN